MRDISQLVRQLRRQGVEVTATHGNHWRVECPRGAVFLPGTPNRGERTLRNMRAQLSRAGIKLP